MKRRNSLYILAAIMVMMLSAFAAPAGSGKSEVEVSLDSTWLLMGRTTPLYVTVTTDATSKGHLFAPGDTLTEGVEVAARTEPDTATLPNGRLRITQTITLQSFDTGNYTLPPIMYIDGADTTFSKRLTLRVVPVNVDTLETIHDYDGVTQSEKKFFDFIPFWISDNATLIWIVLALLIGGFCLWWFYLRKLKDKKPVVVRRHTREITPYERAIMELSKLRQEDLPGQGLDNEFYTRLTEILRKYIDSRFHINAMEMTSTQILRALRRVDDAKLSEMYMRRILEIADYVKFAKLRPFSEDNTQAMEDAVRFVEDTKPTPVTPDENGRPAAPAPPTK